MPFCSFDKAWPQDILKGEFLLIEQGLEDPGTALLVLAKFLYAEASDL
jgi:hypothetical protein